MYRRLVTEVMDPVNVFVKFAVVMCSLYFLKMRKLLKLNGGSHYVFESK